MGHQGLGLMWGAHRTEAKRQVENGGPEPIVGSIMGVGVSEAVQWGLVGGTLSRAGPAQRQDQAEGQGRTGGKSKDRG